MKKRKWSGADLLRSDAKSKQPQPQEAEKPKSKLGRIRTRRVMRGPGGEIIDLTPNQSVWLVQMDGINEILLSDTLKAEGYDIATCEQLHQLPQKLSDTEEFPKLVVLEARAVGQQTPFFRKRIIPLLDDVEIPCLIVGVANETQEQLFRRWYDGPLVVGGDLSSFTNSIKSIMDT